MTEKLNRVLALVLTIVALMTGQTAWAESTWTVEETSHDNQTNVTTFTITRSETGYAQTVLYRTVGLSAYAGQHFTATSGSISFGKDEDRKTVTVTEKTPAADAYAYKYQNGNTTRKYKLEVTDRAGFLLDSATRTMTTGTSFSAAKVSQSITNLVYFSGSNYASGVSNSKYVDVPYTPPTSQVETSGKLAGYVLIDDEYEYAQKAATVSTSDLINTTGASATYLNNIGYKIYATVCFTEQERDDGYQYVQIIAGNSSASYDGADSNGKIDNGPTNSVYKACFELSTSKDDGQGKAFFPHRYDTATGTNEFSPSDGKLWQQKFKSSSYQASTSGSLILNANTSYITTRFDAGGDHDDTWGYKDLFVRMALVDASAPTKSAVSVNPGRHAKGNTVYVSVAFNEIVTVTGTPTLSTTADNHWGSLSYVAGSGTNVLTFSTTIPQNATGNLNITGLSGTVKDLAGNSLTGSGVTASGLCTLDGDLTYTINDFQQEGGNYLIACHDDLWGLASYVNGGNDASGLTFLQVADIAFSHTTNWNNSSSTENNFTRIGDDGHPFQGTFDGGGHTISGIRIYKGGDTWADASQGLFGKIGDGGTVKCVTLADARITGRNYVGGIAGGTFSCTIEDCTVAADVCIHAVQGSTYYHGGIVGSNQANYLRRCISRATLTVANSSACHDFGGIAGKNDCITTDCIADGVVIPDVNGRGAIVGYKSSGTLTRNYYRGCTAAGVANATGVGQGNGENSTATSDVNGARALWAITLGTNVTINRNAQATLPGTNNKTYANGADIAGVPYGYEGATIALGYSGEVSTGYHVEYSATAGIIDGSTLTMPAGNVSVSATVPANTYTVRFYKNDGGEDYTDQGFTYDEAQNLSTNTYTREGYAFTRWNTEADGSGTAYENGQSVSNLTATNGGFVTLYAQWVVPVTYIDENGDEQTCSDYTLITSSDEGVNLGSNDKDNWFVVSGDVTITGWLHLYGSSTHLILMDDATLRINKDGNSVGDCGVNFIYAQSTGNSMGRLVVEDDIDAYAINGGHIEAGSYSTNDNLIINGGKITGDIKTGNCNLIINGGYIDVGEIFLGFNYYEGSIIINGGTVNAGRIETSESHTISHIVINGGNVNVSNRISHEGDGSDITLGWTNLSDRITAADYYRGNVSIKDGQAFYNGTEYLFGTITDMSKLNGKTLVPAITYIDENGVEQACADYTLITSSDEPVTYNAASDQEQWYVVMGGATIKEGLYLGGKPAHLILCDDADLNINSDDNWKNGYLDGTDLHIYGQRNGTGVLETPSHSVTIYGIKCKVTINGGRYRGDICATDNVTINGGTHDINIIDFVENSTGVFTLNGGTAKVFAINFSNNTSKTVNINGGIFILDNGIIAFGGNRNVTINGGTVNVKYDLDSGEEGAIILGWTNPTDRITASSYLGNVSIKDGQAFYNGTEYLFGTITDMSKLNGKTLVPYSTSEIAYIDENGVAQTTPEGVPVLTFTGTETTLGASGKTTWYLVQGNINLQNGVQVSLAGDVNIILADGCSFNGSWYYDLNSYNGHAFTIYAQSTGDDMGQFHVSCEYDIYNGSFNIRGGNIEFSCGYSSALFDVSEGGSVSITGGRVKLNSEDRTFESAGGTVTLGCTAPTDYIYFYDGYTDCSMDVRIKTGQILTDGSHIFSGALTHGESGSSYYDEEQEVYRLRNGHTLRPYTGSLLADNDSDKPAGIKNADIISTLADGNTHIVALQNRIFYQDDDWNTLCLPFDVDDFDDTPLHYATVMELDTEGTYDGHQTGFDATNGTLYLYFKEATSIEAGKPYLVKWDYSHDRYYNPVFNDVTIDNSDEALARSTVTSQDGKVSFCGSYAYQSWASENRSILFLGESSQLYWPLAGAYLGAFRACFHLNGITAANISSARWGFGDESTSLREKVIVNSEEFATAPVYDLQGRKVAQPTKKGLYIYGGRKVVVK